MRRLVATLTGAAVVAAALPAWAASPALTDLTGHWARTQVEAGIAAGYVSGYPDGTFRPNAQITRAEFTKLLTAAMQLKASHNGTGFKEEWQSPLHWSFSQGYIDAAVSAGLLEPSDYEYLLSPDAPISRREMVMEAVRALGEESLTQTYKGALTAPDAAQYPDWLKPYAGLALESGIITGYEDGSLGLSRTATRAEALVIVQRIVKRVSVDATQADAPSGVRHPGEGEPTWAWSGGNGAALTVTNGTASQTYTFDANTEAFHLLPAPGKAAWAAYSQGGTGHVGRLAQSRFTELDTEEGRLPQLLAVDEDGRLWFNYGTAGLAVATPDGDVELVSDVNEQIRFGAIAWDGTFWGVGETHIWRVATDLDVMPYTSELPLDSVKQVMGMAEDGSLWFLTGPNGDTKAEAVRLAFGKVAQRVRLLGKYAGGLGSTAQVDLPGQTGPFVWAVVHTQAGDSERLEGLYRFNLNTGEFARTVLPGNLTWNGAAAADAAGGALLRDDAGVFWRLLP